MAKFSFSKDQRHLKNLYFVLKFENTFILLQRPKLKKKQFGFNFVSFLATKSEQIGKRKITFLLIFSSVLT